MDHASVEDTLTATASVKRKMEASWAKSSVSKPKSLDQLQKLALLGPARLVELNSEAKRVAERKRKEEASNEKRAKEKLLKEVSAKRDKDKRDDVRTTVSEQGNQHLNAHNLRTSKPSKKHKAESTLTRRVDSTQRGNPAYWALRCKIQRLEGEQRVSRVDYREGELEVARFELEAKERALQHRHSRPPPFLTFRDVNTWRSRLCSSCVVCNQHCSKHHLRELLIYITRVTLFNI